MRCLDFKERSRLVEVPTWTRSAFGTPHSKPATIVDWNRLALVQLALHLAAGQGRSGGGHPVMSELSMGLAAIVQYPGAPILIEEEDGAKHLPL